LPQSAQGSRRLDDRRNPHRPRACAKLRSRGVYLLPNLLTTGTLFSGFYAIVAAIDGNFGRAGIAVFVAMVFDGLDGRVARWTNTQSEFGKQYDSLSDMVAFGLAPAIVVYQWGIARIYEYGASGAGSAGSRRSSTRSAAALRLARFNAHAQHARTSGISRDCPSPSAAAVVAGFIWLASDFGRARACPRWCSRSS
jgi:CDP-diacylglycerol--serine O-phosphatidyltransferase